MATPRPSVLLVLVLVALVVLFVVGVGLGARDKPPPSREARLSLRDRLLGRPPKVRPAEIVTAGCGGEPQRPRVPRGATCRLTIGPARRLLRALRVRTTDGVRLVYTPEGRARTPIDVSLRPDGDSEVELTVQRDGAVLALTCQAPTSSPHFCAVTLE